MRRCLFLLALACCLPVSGHSQSTESDLNARLVGQPLYLRGSWGADTLHFDNAGQLIGNSDHRSFTLCGVDVKKIHLKDDRLILDARRVGVELDKAIPERILLQVGGLISLHDEALQIDISRPSDGDYGPALTAIFANGLADLTPSLPEYWQGYATFLPASAPASTAPPTPSTYQVKRVGGSIKPPVLIKSIEPRFTDAARKLKYQANIVIGLIVDENGLPSHLRLIKPAGLGLDEQALYAVQGYAFRPATENGSPVRVQLKVEVNFQIF